MVTMFHSDEWIEGIAEMQGLKVGRIDNWTYTWSRKYGLPVMQMPVKTPYFSPTGTTEQCEQAIKKLRKKFWYVHAHYSPGYMGKAHKVHYTYIHDFKDGFNFSRSLTEQLRKAERLNYEFKEGSNHKDAYLIEQKSFVRTGLNCNYSTPKRFEEFIHSIPEIGDYTISLDGIDLGYYYVVIDGDTAYAWVSAFDYEWQSTRLNQLLTVLMLEDLKRKGIRYFDFVGADTESIARYKAQFNFELVPSYSVTYKKW